MKKKLQIWQTISGILAIAIIALFLYKAPMITTTGCTVLDKDSKANTAVDFLNKYILSRQGVFATVNSIVEEQGMIIIDLEIEGKNYPMYLTGDGNKLFPQFVDLKAEVPVQQESPQQTAEISVEGRNFKGVEDAKVTIVEYSSFSCGYCNKVKSTINQIIETYPNDVKIVFKHSNGGGNNATTAQATECAGDQGKFWEMHDTIFDKGSSGDLKAYAKELALDEEAFNECLESGKYAAQVTADTNEGRANGASGTPSFLINGKLLKGAQPFEVFKSIIDSELAKQ